MTYRFDDADADERYEAMEAIGDLLASHPALAQLCDNPKWSPERLATRTSRELASDLDLLRSIAAAHDRQRERRTA